MSPDDLTGGLGDAPIDDEIVLLEDQGGDPPTPPVIGLQDNRRARDTRR